MRVALASLLLFSWPLLAADDNWPQFRGVEAAGIAQGHSLPETFDIKSDEGVLWRREVEGLGMSSPVVWGDTLFLTTAVSGSDLGDVRTGIYGDIGSVEDDSEHVWKVLAFQKQTGELLWETPVHRGVPAVKRHPKSSHANATAATDGKHLVAFFGSEGLFCLDLDGNVLWSKNFGVLDAGYFSIPDAQWEFGNSPVIHSGKVVVLADVQEGSFLAVYRLSDGEQRWRVDREDVPTWGAPLVVSTGQRTQVVVNGWLHTGGYDFETGEPLWRVTGGGDLPVPTPIYGDGRFYFTSAHGEQSPVYAAPDDLRGLVNLAKGDDEGLTWVVPRRGAYMATPLLLHDLLYVLRWNGVLVCIESATGKVVYEKRLPSGAYTASPVAGDGKIYAASEDGDVTVVRAGRDFEILHKTKTPDSVLASPAISEGVLYLRTLRELIAVGEN